MKVVLLTNIPSPFMLQFADAINRSPGMEYHVAFCKDSLEDRGSHWRDRECGGDRAHYYHSKSGQALGRWLVDILESLKPDVVLLGYGRGPVFRLAARNKGRLGYVLGMWSEQPPQEWQDRWILNRLRRCLFRRIWRTSFDFILSIGDRAAAIHQEFQRKDPTRIFCFPYVQSIPCRDLKSEAGSILRFLFSGRLVKRNNIRLICRCIEDLAKTHPGKFTFCFSASGPEEEEIQGRTRRSPAFARHICFDREFAQWDDRLRPFMVSDVLVVPARHSGWGLVVSEALSLGLPVISTRGVEAARYFVRHMENGILIRPKKWELLAAMRYCIESRPDVERMSVCARRITEVYSAEKGSALFSEIMYSVYRRSLAERSGSRGEG